MEIEKNIPFLKLSIQIFMGDKMANKFLRYVKNYKNFLTIDYHRVNVPFFRAGPLFIEEIIFEENIKIKNESKISRNQFIIGLSFMIIGVILLIEIFNRSLIFFSPLIFYFSLVSFSAASETNKLIKLQKMTINFPTVYR